ncbi:hypothetical protein RH858_13190 [Halalkaliarchaeum sp. AArc-GB]|uniref:hypothetical protein n=1 Tax=Halalkaliarchaeum sp. AArc-GB TaxID=3074078 RepID=UPI00285597BB|nr:hypothetical protein [Halalkaliarchaeum sp. AArc-GB]MDR5674085.1 hypothetical protein [Halalkaliarchaeum sp. AArc-GB]
MRERLPVLDRRTYRWTDRLTKLAGVLAVAVALEVGIVSGGGIALALAGVVLALSTVPIETTPATDAGSTDAFEGEPT